MATAGPDSIVGTSGNDSLDGLGGSDTIIGSDGNDTLIGGGGNDYLIGGTGTDVASYAGATGPITVNLGDGTVTGDGNDVVDSIEKVVGTSLADTFFGGDLEHDTVLSLTSELFEGRGGNDTINGWQNFDEVVAPYADATSPFGGSIFVLASYLNSPTGVGVNLGVGTASDGWGGTDTLINVAGVQGSNNNDSIVGGGSHTNSFGTRFELFQPMAGNDTVDGGNSVDRVSYSFLSAAQPIAITLNFDSINGATGTAVAASIGKSDTLLNIEQVQGGAGNDSLTGSNRTDTSEGFRGSEGNDTINGNGGFDVVQYFNSTSGVVVNLQTGTASDGFGGTDSLSNLEGINGSNFDDSLTGANSTVSGSFEFLEPLAGNDTIDGGTGAQQDEVAYVSAPSGVVVDLLAGTAQDGFGYVDTLLNIENVRGTMFSDTLIGNGANNSFRGLWGLDSIDGGAGIDTANYDQDPNDAGDSITGVNVSLATGIGIDAWGTPDTLVNIENVRGSNFNDFITGSATVANLLDGLNGHDHLQGLSGNDTLIGGGGNDKVDGGSGNDSMTGGTGDDLYWVNAASDKVIENASEGFDTVRSTIGITLGSANISTNVESVTLLGSNNINATGNNLANVLRGNVGNNSLNGGVGTANDTLNGGVGNDTLEGGGGDDFLQGAGGFDIANFFGGGSGANINLNQNLATNDGRNYTDKLFSIEQVIGTAQADTLTGGGELHSRGLNIATQFEVLEGRAGNDVISNLFETVFVMAGYAGAGSAVYANLQAGTASDGDGGTDTFLVNGNIWLAGLQGSAFDDTLIGGGGYVTESGGSYEIFEGLAGDDSIDGLFGQDRVQYTFSPGAVNVDLGSGTALDGFGGTDTLVNIERVLGSSFNDTLTGSDGGAFFEGFEGRAGNDVIDGGTGGMNVVLYTASPDGVLINLGTGVAQDGWGGTDTLTNIQVVGGSYYNDTLTGSAADETLSGSAGADTLDGGAGFDCASYLNDAGAVVVNLATLTAKDGWGDTDTLANFEAVQGSGFDDSLTGSAAGESFAGGRGDDTIDGGGGIDTLVFSNDVTLPNVGVTVDLAAGVTTDALGGHDTLLNLENIEGSIYNDALYGAAGINVIMGMGGSDTIGGGLGADSLDGGDGDDLMDGGGGNDNMTGGLGDDVFLVNAAGDVVNENSGQGDDLVVSTASTYTLSANLEDLFLSGGGAINGNGNGGDNLIQGNSDDNLLSGSGGSDTLRGSAGVDGLNGGNGIDTLVGGLGADTFTFDAVVGTAAASVNRDVIRDFLSGTDTLDLAASRFSGIGTAGNPMTAGAFNSGIGMTTAQQADDRIIYDEGSGKLYYDADGSAAGSNAVLFMTLSSAPTLTAADIQVI